MPTKVNLTRTFSAQDKNGGWHGFSPGVVEIPDEFMPQLEKRKDIYSVVHDKQESSSDEVSDETPKVTGKGGK